MLAGDTSASFFLSLYHVAPIRLRGRRNPNVAKKKKETHPGTKNLRNTVLPAVSVS